MSQDIRLDVSYAEKFVTEPEAEGMKPAILAAQKTLMEKTGPGAEFTGWVRLPETYDREEFSRIKKAAEKIRDESRILVVTGVGGSYLGARAAIEFLSKGRGESG
ncbi:MAG: glucose-6-phosphate isomerase, partial [Lachnospiraceae bacterium]|nr:glucose-6-phosphate isomerase [Candidatus Hippenecus merdae]